MESTDLKIEKQDLKLTKEGFFRLFTALRKEGASMQKAYNKIALVCRQEGLQNYYKNFNSLKWAVYTEIEK